MLPSFQTERLFLRPRTLDDFNECLAMDKDSEVTKYIPGPWSDPVQHERFLSERIQKSFGPGLGYWSIFPKEQSSQFVGWILLIPYDGIGPEIEIGWRLNRFAWGKGYATEAARRVLEHAFKTVGVGRVVADIHPENQPSIRVAEKIGLTFVGDSMHDGFPCKSYVMTRNDYSDHYGV
ncbi:GNAT family N-acetyltransferase [Brevibacillus ruminantium]|uniref:GNAT family N-acetyltransferase n=1 Tax=Brevibacillus ruminantium TaxID=2950604 RepID=A0ABY4WTC8_9BACL|nr:GNAT family N-acetyltransferase [Brevibacillus ruminantium]USG67856.1 GNAT family N-acetyltransferase [Brevibacillus ruminantium]